jgi:hypothetical protein
VQETHSGRREDADLALLERTDPAARIGLITSLASGAFKNEWDQVAMAKLPVTLIVGADDHKASFEISFSGVFESSSNRQRDTLSCRKLL